MKRFHRIHRGTPVLASIAVVLLAVTPATWGDLVTVDVDLGLTPPAPPINSFTVTVTAEAMGTTKHDSDTANVTGNVLAGLGIEFDPVTHAVTSVDQLEITGGRINLSNMSFKLDYGFLIGSISATGNGISGTLDTPNPPGSVTDGKFNTADHQVILDNGQFHAWGEGLLLGGQFDQSFDLAAQPIEATTELTGTLDASLLGVVDGTATYDVTMNLPVDFSDEVYNEGDIVVSVAAAGTVQAIGQFTRSIPLPYGVVTPTISTHLEEAAPGATSFARAAGDVELEWTLAAPRVDGTAAVDGTFTDPDDENNHRQFHVNNADTVATSEPIDVRDFAGVQVAVDVRSWDTSSGFESDDDVDLSVIASYDGVNFPPENELFWLEIEGGEITALGNGQNGSFTTFGSPVGLIPDDVASIKVVVDVDNNSNNEHVMWDNVVVAGIPLATMSALTWDGTGDGLWSASGRWTGGTAGQVPSHASDVTVPADTVTVDADAEAYTLSITDPGKVIVDAEKTLAVGPSVSVGSGGMLEVAGTLSTYAANVEGRLDVQAGGTATVADALTVPVGGKLTGNGTVEAETITMGGVVSPGNESDNIGTLTVGNGNMTLADSAMYHAQVNPADASADLIEVSASGSLQLGGLLGVTSVGRIDANSWAAGVSRRIVNSPAGTVTGTGFDDVLPAPAADATSHFGQGVFLRDVHVAAEGVDLELFVAWGGDADGDGKVFLADWGLLRANFGIDGSGLSWTDGNFDPWIDDKVFLSDWGLLRARFGSADYTAAGAAAVPEPGTLAMLLGGLAGLAVLIWRRTPCATRG